MAWVYAIECVPTGELYIGSTLTTVAARFAQHRSALKRGNGRTPLLQAAYDKYGADSLRVIPMKEFLEAEVRDREAEAVFKVQPALNAMKYAERHRSTSELKRIARETGLALATIRAREAYGWTDEQMTRTKYDNVLRYLVHGEELTVRELSAKYGVTEFTIRNRAARGVIGDDLVTQGRLRKKYLIGSEMLTVEEIMIKFSMEEKTVWSRLSRGLCGQEFVTYDEGSHRGKVVYPPVPRLKRWLSFCKV